MLDDRISTALYRNINGYYITEGENKTYIDLKVSFDKRTVMPNDVKASYTSYILIPSQLFDANGVLVQDNLERFVIPENPTTSFDIPDSVNKEFTLRLVVRNNGKAQNKITGTRQQVQSDNYLSFSFKEPPMLLHDEMRKQAAQDSEEFKYFVEASGQRVTGYKGVHALATDELTTVKYQSHLQTSSVEYTTPHVWFWDEDSQDFFVDVPVVNGQSFDGNELGKRMPEPPIENHPGMEFAGWNTELDGSGELIMSGTPIIAKEKEFDNPVLNLCAQWRPIGSAPQEQPEEHDGAVTNEELSDNAPEVTQTSDSSLPVQEAESVAVDQRAIQPLPHKEAVSDTVVQTGDNALFAGAAVLFVISASRLICAGIQLNRKRRMYT